jgi:hypothetical protein
VRDNRDRALLERDASASRTSNPAQTMSFPGAWWSRVMMRWATSESGASPSRASSARTTAFANRVTEERGWIIRWSSFGRRCRKSVEHRIGSGWLDEVSSRSRMICVRGLGLDQARPPPGNSPKAVSEQAVADGSA